MRVYDRLTDEQQDRINAILPELESITREWDSFLEDHETIIDVLIDSREDDGLPPYTPEELAALSAKCEANAEYANELENQIDNLKAEYFSLTGHLPFFSWGRRFEHPHAIFAEDDESVWEYENRKVDKIRIFY